MKLKWNQIEEYKKIYVKNTCVKKRYEKQKADERLGKSMNNQSYFVGSAKKPLTSFNTAFTLRDCRPLVRLRNFEEVNQADNPAQPNRVAATPVGRLRQ